MAIVITHAKTDTLNDWTQAELDAAIAGTPPPIPPGTLLVDIVLPRDWNDPHVINGLATVAETGDYADLINAPVLAAVATSGAYADLSGTPALATVATTGDYDDLINKPTIPAGTVTSVSVTTANGVSGSVANATTTPAISFTLGAITPTSVAATGNVTGLNLSGTNTGDQNVFNTTGSSDFFAFAAAHG
jgi:hypothetical protein